MKMSNGKVETDAPAVATPPAADVSAATLHDQIVGASLDELSAAATASGNKKVFYRGMLAGVHLVGFDRGVMAALKALGVTS
jgi:hypothetical protein